MTRTEKRLEVLSRQMTELRARISADTESLEKMETEYEALTARRVTDFVKKQNLVIDDKFFEMLYRACSMENGEGNTEKISLFVPETTEQKRSGSLSEEVKEDKDNELF